MRAIIGSIGIAAALIITFGGCSDSQPDNTSQGVSIGAVNIQVTGAGIIAANANNITYQARCAICGTQGNAQTIATPAAGSRPMKSEWACPKCNHRHMVMFTVSKP